MKPLKLTMRNAGPFKDEEIDFTLLENMFLVCGNTGAGKTSIFDAITFALYGKLNGERDNINGARDFYSTYASPNQDGYVVFKFEIFGKTYQITRTIPRTYINRNGAESITVSTLEFGEIDSKGFFTNISGKKTELEEKIKNLIGFSHEDFSKIVVLPQGQFSEFLKQKSSARKETLSKLFNVDDYKAIVDNAKKQLDEKKQAIKTIQVLISSLKEKFNPESAEDELKNYEKEIQKTQKSLEKEEAAKKDCIEQKSKLEAEFSQAKKAEDNAKKLAELEEQKSENEEKQKTILRTKEALLYADKIQNASDAKTAVDSLEQKSKQKESELKENKNSIALTEKEFHALCKNQNEIQKEYEAQREKVQAEKEALQEQKNILEKSKEKDGLQKEISSLNKEIKQADEELKTAQKLVESTESQIKELEDLDAQNEIQSASIILVKQLKDKKPCPICGSLDHPAPFVAKQTEFNIKEKLKTEKAQLKVNQKALNDCNTQATKLATKLEEKSARLKEYSPTLPDAQTAQSNHKTAETAFNTMNDLFKTLTELKKDYDTLLKENSSLTSALEIIKENLKTAKEKSAKAAEELQNALASSSFASVEECQNAALEKSALKELEEDFDEWKREYDEYKTLVEKQDKCEKSETIKKKIDAFKEQENAINEKISALNNVLVQNKTSHNELKKLSEDYIKKSAEFESMQKEIAPYEMLYNDLSQHNPKGISFDTWILAYYFTEVVSYANKRFYEISQGRYEFKISEQTGGAGYKGLDLLVTDSYTGKDRDTSTLSGGETFMASISLALALTDVVQNRNGGIQLDSIFIDEGFGTLDEETLNCAMGILNDLQETKMVGIISHIESMRTQIPSHIEVQKTMSGSHIKII